MDSTQALNQTPEIVPRETLSKVIQKYPPINGAKKRGGTKHIVQYTPGIIDKIFTLVTEGKSIKKICSFKAMPSLHTFLNWLDQYPELKPLYAQARARRAHLQVEQAEEEPDIAIADVMRLDSDDKRCNALVQAHKLKADVKLKIAGINNRQDYGDAPTVQVNTAIGIRLELGDCAPIRFADR